ncbi:hypothetical protein SRHO_G00249450 [Serrasalmus rhombeus]
MAVVEEEQLGVKRTIKMNGKALATVFMVVAALNVVNAQTTNSISTDSTTNPTVVGNTNVTDAPTTTNVSVYTNGSTDPTTVSATGVSAGTNATNGITVESIPSFTANSTTGTTVESTTGVTTTWTNVTITAGLTSESSTTATLPASNVSSPATGSITMAASTGNTSEPSPSDPATSTTGIPQGTSTGVSNTSLPTVITSGISSSPLSGSTTGIILESSTGGTSGSPSSPAGTTGVTLGTTTSAGSTLVSTVATSGPSTSSPAGSNTVITQGPSTGVSVISASTGVTTQPTSSLSPTAVATTDVKQVSFTSNETFSSDLLNSSSAAFVQRSERVKSQLEPVFKATFTTFFKLTVISFKEGSIITLMNLEFSAGSAPSDTAVVTTVLTAKTSLNITAASVITTTTSTTQIPTLLPSTTTTTTQQVYVVELSNPQSQQFQSLASVVVVSFDKIYKLQYGILFVRTVVIAFRPGTTRAQNVEADVQLIFNENSTKPIPAATEIVSTLKEAISNPNSGFTLPVDPTSITVVSSPQIVTVVIFTNGTFVTDLSNPTSALFTTRSSMIKTGLEPFFTADYPSAFSSLALTNFSDGGYSLTLVKMIQNSMDLSFGASATLPNTTQIGQTIIRAAKNNSLPFQIFTSKIIVNGTVISSSEVSSKISVFTAIFMVAISLLVTWSS